MARSRIEIKFFNTDAEKSLFSGDAAYRSGNPGVDSVSITNRNIVIESNRASAPQKSLSQHNSTFHKQIIKTLCLYYALERKPNQIDSISITSTRAKISSSQSLSGNQIRQAVSSRTALAALASVKQPNAELVLEESKRGNAVLYAITHLIKSLDTDSEFDRFERLWRAFNALYRAHMQKPSDHACHVALREYIENNPGLFPLSLGKVSALTAPEIRSKIKWNLMIQNNYPTQKRAKALKESILRVKDSRILEIYKDSLPIRQAHLKAEGLITDVNTHIQLGLSNPIKLDSDVLATLCIKYMYFVRNKIAHAERTDHGFTFLMGSADENEIRWLTPFLEALVIDLVNL